MKKNPCTVLTFSFAYWLVWIILNSVFTVAILVVPIVFFSHFEMHDCVYVICVLLSDAFSFAVQSLYCQVEKLSLKTSQNVFFYVFQKCMTDNEDRILVFGWTISFSFRIAMWSSVQCASGKSCHRTQTVEYLNIMTADTTWLNKLTVVASASFLNILFVNSVTPKDKYWDDMQCPPLFPQHYYSYMIVFNSCH